MGECWCSAAAGRRFVGGSPAVVEIEGRIWASRSDLGSSSHDQDARLLSPTAPVWPGCAFSRSVWLVFGPEWLGLSAGTGTRRKDRQ
jgi:hypothetical protein